MIQRPLGQTVFLTNGKKANSHLTNLVWVSVISPATPVMKSGIKMWFLVQNWVVTNAIKRGRNRFWKIRGCGIMAKDPTKKPGPKLIHPKNKCLWCSYRYRFKRDFNYHALMNHYPDYRKHITYQKPVDFSFI